MNTDAKIPFKILFEDNHLIVCIKPHGVVSEADEHHEIALDSLMKEFIKIRDKKPGNVFLTPVHRLDKPAAGLIILAKTSKALTRMHEMMQKRLIGKTYYAHLDKVPSFPKGHLSHYLTHKFHKAEVTNVQEGKKAELDYEVVKSDKSGCFVKISLHTGRYHQIRAQFAAIGSPITGDTRYGSLIKLPSDAIALFHTKTTFVHPVTKLEMVFEFPESQVPIDVFLDTLLAPLKGQR